MNIEKQAKKEASEFLADLDRKRARQLGRGNILLQRGMFRNQEEWDALRADHPARLERLGRMLGAK